MLRLKALFAQLFTVVSSQGTTDGHDAMRGVLLSILTGLAAHIPGLLGMLLPQLVQALPGLAMGHPVLLLLVPAVTYILNDIISRLPGAKTVPKAE